MQLTTEDREELEKYKQEHSKRIQERNKRRKQQQFYNRKMRELGIYSNKSKGDSEQH